MQKEIILALQFSSAPKELQDAAKNYNQVATKLTSSIIKKADLEKEIAQLEISEGEALKVFRKLLSAWEPK